MLRVHIVRLEERASEHHLPGNSDTLRLEWQDTLVEIIDERDVPLRLDRCNDARSTLWCCSDRRDIVDAIEADRLDRLVEWPAMVGNVRGAELADPFGRFRTRRRSNHGQAGQTCRELDHDRPPPACAVHNK